MSERLAERCKTSKRMDDTGDIIKKRISNYDDQTKPVFEYYRSFGRTRTVDGMQDSTDVYKQARDLMRPQLMFMIGPKTSGKTTIGSHMSARTNMHHINFNDWLKTSSYKGKDDESVVLGFINSLAYYIQPRILVENFP